MHRSLIHFTLALTIALLIGVGWRQCANTPERPAQPCFYFWKTEMNFDSTEWKRFARISGQQPLYLRLFDVDYSAGYGNSVPVGDVFPIETTNISDGRVLIPTVYITNRVFEHLSDSLTLLLAKKIHRRILNRLESWKSAVGWQLLPYQDGSTTRENERRDSLREDWLKRCDEIQIDCDWTAATRIRYFKFLSAFRAQVTPRRVSCTVRLHQYRDRSSAGIPPVDRGMLMCYNVADPKRASTPDAIFDPRLVKGYLKATRYPLPLDVALPMFSWGAWFRDEKFMGLLAGWEETNTSNSTLYQPESPGRYRVLQDTVIGRDYLREGDLVRLDQPAEADLLDIVGLLREQVRGRDSRLVFFDWQTEKIARYEKIVTACAARFE